MNRNALRGTSRKLATAGALAASLAGTAMAQTTCPAPTVAQCQDHDFYQTDCGKLQTGASSQCATLLKPLGQQAFDAIPASTTRQMIDPISGTARPTKVPTYYDANRKADGNLAVYAGRIAATELAAAPKAPATSTTTATTSGFIGRAAPLAGRIGGIVVQIDPKTLWNWNGPAVTSCEEFAYEKFYDYSVFEDKASGLTADSDYRGAFNLAYDATNGISYKNLHTKSGGYLQFSAWWPMVSVDEFGGGTSKLPKNAFYTAYSVAKSSGFQLNDTTLGAQLDAGVGYWSQSQDWAWQQSMSNQLASVPDDQLDAISVKEDDIQALAMKRYQLAQSMVGLTTRNSTPDPDVAKQLAAYDQQLRDALHEAATMGCIDNTKTTMCDWSPRQFWKQMDGFMAQRREWDYQRCIAETGNNFNSAKNALALGFPKADYTTTSENFDDFLGRYQTYMANQPTMKDPASGKTVLGQKAGDSGTLGNDKFGVTYGWDAAWQVTGFEGSKQACNAAAHALGDLYVNGTIFGSSYDVFKAQATADSSATTSAKLAIDLFLADQNIYHADKTVGPYHLAVHPSVSKSFEGSYTFLVLAVPVTLKGGIQAAAGLDATLDVTTNNTCGNNTVTLAEAKGLAKPWIKADAYASAGIDVFIADAGVKLTLTLIDAQLPLNGDVKVYMEPLPAPATTGQVLVDANMNLELKLRSLDGKFSVYVDSIFGDDEETLLSWDGFSVDETLFGVGRNRMDLGQVKKEIDQQNGYVGGGIGIIGTVGTVGSVTAVSL